MNAAQVRPQNRGAKERKRDNKQAQLEYRQACEHIHECLIHGVQLNQIRSLNRMMH